MREAPRIRTYLDLQIQLYPDLQRAVLLVRLFGPVDDPRLSQRGNAAILAFGGLDAGKGAVGLLLKSGELFLEGFVRVLEGGRHRGGLCLPDVNNRGKVGKT